MIKLEIYSLPFPMCSLASSRHDARMNVADDQEVCRRRNLWTFGQNCIFSFRICRAVLEFRTNSSINLMSHALWVSLDRHVGYFLRSKRIYWALIQACPATLGRHHSGHRARSSAKNTSMPRHGQYRVAIQLQAILGSYPYQCQPGFAKSDPLKLSYSITG